MGLDEFVSNALLPERPDVVLVWDESAEVWANISPKRSKFTLTISIGLVRRTKLLWLQFLEFRRPTGLSLNGINEVTSLSLFWLYLHEISHIDLRHFKFFERFGVSRRTEDTCASFLPSSCRRFLRPALEMQADHEALDVYLGAYTSAGWGELRQKVSAISAMMVLIELEEAKLEFEQQTHPKAATRIFQLLCHVAEMPLLNAHLQKDASLLPAAEEIERYGKKVTLPCFFDALHLAEVAGAESIEADLGNPEHFFADMAVVKLDDLSKYCDLKTEGAREWAQLWECNEALKTLQKGVHFAN